MQQMMISTRKAPFGAVSILILAGLMIPTAAQLPKMIAEPASPGKDLGPPRVQKDFLSSNSTVYVGDCSPTKPFMVPIFGPSGRGAVGVEAPADSKGISVVASEGGSASMGDQAISNFFGVESQPEYDFQGYPMQFVRDADYSGPGGVPVEIRCTSNTPIVVIFNDDVDFSIQVAVTESQDGDDIELVNGVAAKTPLSGYTRPGKGQSSSPVSFKSATATKISATRQRGNDNKGMAIVSGIFTTSSGHDVRRSFVRNVKPKKNGAMNPPRPITADCCEINDDGDVNVRFPGLAQQDEYLRVDTRFGIVLDGAAAPVEVVDVAATLTKDGYITVHGGWIRKALEELGMQEQTEGWSVTLVDLVVSDPDQGYRVVGVKGNVINNGIPPGLAKRALLSKGPTEEERGISLAMKMGKMPSADERRRQLQGSNLRRELSGVHKKILVHGYCAGYPNPNPFPVAHFTDALAFSYGTTKNNWSHSQFAQNILSFTSGLHGCGCIAHSQGGAACLTLYTYWWSCLDYAANSGNMIQSVGTPYQGTSLAGNLAVIGEVFGVGCGEQYDLTYSGAATWLSGIPSWARSKVRYHTTSFTDVWWRYDYCQIASDLLLSDPDDGAVERAAGQLPGAVNGGHTTGWCHSTGMSYPSQTTDAGRNSYMNVYAQY